MFKVSISRSIFVAAALRQNLIKMAAFNQFSAKLAFKGAKATWRSTKISAVEPPPPKTKRPNFVISANAKENCKLSKSAVHGLHCVTQDGAVWKHRLNISAQILSRRKNSLGVLSCAPPNLNALGHSCHTQRDKVITMMHAEAPGALFLRPRQRLRLKKCDSAFPHRQSRKL